MTTEEKKCICYESVARVVARNPKCPVNHIATPPETGREWEDNLEKLIGKRTNTGDLGGEIYPAYGLYENLKDFIRSIESSALAQGEAYKGKAKREWYMKGVTEGVAQGKKEERKIWLDAIKTQKMSHGMEKLSKMIGITVNDVLRAVINVHDNTIDALKG